MSGMAIYLFIDLKKVKLGYIIVRSKA